MNFTLPVDVSFCVTLAGYVGAGLFHAAFRTQNKNVDKNKEMVVPRFTRNSTLQQLLDDHMVERIVYNIGEQQELIPSRHTANMIFDRY